MSEKYVELQIDNPNEAVMLLGMSDANITLIEETYSVQIITRGEVIQIAGDDLEKKNQAYAVLEALLKVIRKNINIDQRDVSTAIEMASKGTIEYYAELYDEEIARNTKGKPIRAKTIGQREYIRAIRHKDLIFGIGPAGTGKTYLAVVMATQALKMAM